MNRNLFIGCLVLLEFLGRFSNFVSGHEEFGIQTFASPVSKSVDEEEESEPKRRNQRNHPLSSGIELNSAEIAKGKENANWSIHSKSNLISGSSNNPKVFIKFSISSRINQDGTVEHVPSRLMSRGVLPSQELIEISDFDEFPRPAEGQRLLSDEECKSANRDTCGGQQVDLGNASGKQQVNAVNITHSRGNLETSESGRNNFSDETLMEERSNVGVKGNRLAGNTGKFSMDQFSSPVHGEEIEKFRKRKKHKGNDEFFKHSGKIRSTPLKQGPLKGVGKKRGIPRKISFGIFGHRGDNSNSKITDKFRRNSIGIENAFTIAEFPISLKAPRETVHSEPFKYGKTFSQKTKRMSKPCKTGKISEMISIPSQIEGGERANPITFKEKETFLTARKTFVAQNVNAFSEKFNEPSSTQPIEFDRDSKEGEGRREKRNEENSHSNRLREIDGGNEEETKFRSENTAEKTRRQNKKGKGKCLSNILNGFYEIRFSKKFSNEKSFEPIKIHSQLNARYFSKDHFKNSAKTQKSQSRKSHYEKMNDSKEKEIFNLVQPHSTPTRPIHNSNSEKIIHRNSKKTKVTEDDLHQSKKKMQNSGEKLQRGKLQSNINQFSNGIDKKRSKREADGDSVKGKIQNGEIPVTRNGLPRVLQKKKLTRLSGLDFLTRYDKKKANPNGKLNDDFWKISTETKETNKSSRKTGKAKTENARNQESFPPLIKPFREFRRPTPTRSTPEKRITKKLTIERFEPTQIVSTTPLTNDDPNAKSSTKRTEEPRTDFPLNAASRERKPKRTESKSKLLKLLITVKPNAPELPTAEPEKIAPEAIEAEKIESDSDGRKQLGGKTREYEKIHFRPRQPDVDARSLKPDVVARFGKPNIESRSWKPDVEARSWGPDVEAKFGKPDFSGVYIGPTTLGVDATDKNFAKTTTENLGGGEGRRHLEITEGPILYYVVNEKTGRGRWIKYPSSDKKKFQTSKRRRKILKHKSKTTRRKKSSGEEF